MQIKEITFYKTSEALPEKSGEYLCHIEGEYVVLHYSTKHKLFNTFDNFTDKEAKKTSIFVTEWAELPQL